MLTRRGLPSLLGALAMATMFILPAQAGNFDRSYAIPRDCVCAPPVRQPLPVTVVPQPYYVVDQGPGSEPPIGARVLDPSRGFAFDDPNGGFGWFPDYGPVGHGYWHLR